MTREDKSTFQHAMRWFNSSERTPGERAAVWFATARLLGDYQGMIARQDEAARKMAPVAAWCLACEEIELLRAA